MEKFSALLALCAGNSSASGEFPSQRPVTGSFGVFFHLCLNKRLSNHEASGLRRHRAHYDVIAMVLVGKQREDPVVQLFLTKQLKLKCSELISRLFGFLFIL